VTITCVSPACEIRAGLAMLVLASAYPVVVALSGQVADVSQKYSTVDPARPKYSHLDLPLVCQ